MSESPSDAELFRIFLILFIIWLVFAIVCFALPYAAIFGVIFLIAAVFFLIIYLVKPEGFRKKLLEIWEKKQAKKNK